MSKENWVRLHLILIIGLAIMLVFETITRTEMLLALIYLQLTFSKYYASKNQN